VAGTQREQDVQKALAHTVWDCNYHIVRITVKRKLAYSNLKDERGTELGILWEMGHRKGQRFFFDLRLIAGYFVPVTLVSTGAGRMSLTAEKVINIGLDQARSPSLSITSKNM
jgi:hypothetical protein